MRGVKCRVVWLPPVRSSLNSQRAGLAIGYGRMCVLAIWLKFEGRKFTSEGVRPKAVDRAGGKGVPKDRGQL